MAIPILTTKICIWQATPPGPEALGNWAFAISDARKKREGLAQF